MDTQIIQLGLVDDEEILIDLAALDLAATDHPGVDLTPYRTLLNTLAERVAGFGSRAQSADDQARALSTILAGEFEFSGDRETYDDPANVDLIQVIDRRKGLPIALAIIYVGVARRLGWTAEALNTPGHVLVRIGRETDNILVDPFRNGVEVSPDALARLLQQTLGRSTTPTREHIEPMSNRQILVRLLLNLAQRAEQSGDRARALELQRRMTGVAPQHGPAWWERARLELTGGEVDNARASLGAMLEVTRDSNMRAQISATLEALAGRAES